MRDEHLDERMRYEGRAGQPEGDCSHCFLQRGTVRCEDCLGREIICRGCCVVSHARLPLHRVQEWNGEYFSPTSLYALGLCVQLGENHHPGSLCMWGHDLNADFWVLHTNGMHHVAVKSCGCTRTADENALKVYKQLLRIGWYPASHLDPKTCATFEVMKLFHLLSLQGKMSHYDFYKTLQYRTDNTGTVKLPVRDSLFPRCLRINMSHSIDIAHSLSSRANGDTRLCLSEAGERMTPVKTASRRRLLASWRFPVEPALFLESIYQTTGTQHPKTLRKTFAHSLINTQLILTFIVFCTR